MNTKPELVTNPSLNISKCYKTESEEYLHYDFDLKVCDTILKATASTTIRKKDNISYTSIMLISTRVNIEKEWDSFESLHAAIKSLTTSEMPLWLLTDLGITWVCESCSDTNSYRHDHIYKCDECFLEVCVNCYDFYNKKCKSCHEYEQEVENFDEMISKKEDSSGIGTPEYNKGF